MKGRGRTMAKVVAFVLASAVFTLGLAVKIGNIQLFSHTYGLSAVFSDASGVFKGDDVKLAGVDVGRVSGTELHNPDFAALAQAYGGHGEVVEKTADFAPALARAVAFTNEQKLPAVIIVAIRWRNVLGLRFLYVYPGPAGGQPLNAGDTVPISHTQDAGDIGQFLNELGPILQAINPNEANAFLDSVNNALGGSEVAIRSLLDNAAVLSSSLGSKDKEIGDLVQNSAKVMAAYASQSGNLGTILDDLNTLGVKLSGINGQIDSLITNFADVQNQLNHILVKNRSNIDATLSGLKSVTGILAANKGNLEQTLCSLPTGLAPYYATSSWGQWFNVRVVQVVFKDNSGRQISSAQEQPQQRANGPQQVVTCNGAPSLQGGGTAQAASGSPSGPSASGLTTFLDSVTGDGRVG